MKFTLKQLRNWKRYERVRDWNKLDMYDPRARKMTGLNADDYLFVIQHYLELKEAVKNAKSKR